MEKLAVGPKSFHEARWKAYLPSLKKNDSKNKLSQKILLSSC